MIDLPQFLVGDARDLEIGSHTVDCVITSPPYAMGIDYGPTSDLFTAGEYLDLVNGTSVEIARILRPGGRVFVVVPPTLPQRFVGADPTERWSPSEAWAMGLADSELLYRDTIVWLQDVPDDAGGAQWGSYLSPNAPNFRGRYENVLVFYQETWDRGRIERNDCPPDLWPTLTRNVWPIRPRPSAGSGHPCPFPDELASRCLLSSTWPGDLVVDPFAGSGTTLRVANGLGRRAIGVDSNPQYAADFADRGVQEGLGL